MMEWLSRCHGDQSHPTSPNSPLLFFFTAFPSSPQKGQWKSANCQSSCQTVSEERMTDAPQVLRSFLVVFFSFRPKIFHLPPDRRATTESKLKPTARQTHLAGSLPTALTFAYSFKRKLLSDVCARVFVSFPACVYCGVYASPRSRFMHLSAAELAAAAEAAGTAVATLLGVCRRHLCPRRHCQRHQRWQRQPCL